jgi:lysophospholipase L1-like esterase
MRVALGTAAGIVAIITAALLYLIRQMNKLPDNSPERFLEHRKRGRIPGDAQVVVFLGASLVQGRVCISFVDLLAQRYRQRGEGGAILSFVNAGINGDTSYHALRRLDPIVACDPDYIVILLGTNDVSSTISRNAWRAYRGEKRLSGPLTLDLYRDNMRAIVRQLKERTQARIALSSLPVMGEDLSTLPNRRVRNFNAVLKELAEQQSVSYIPIYETEAAFLAIQQQRERIPGKPYHGNPSESLRLGFLANLNHYLLGRSYDAVSHLNGMALKIDHLHSNSQEAALIADQIEGFLNASNIDQ